MTPFSKNIIFFDTEFTTLNPVKGELISIGLVKYGGEELYIELPYRREDCEPWVEDHVLPHLEGREETSREEARTRIAGFVGRGKPYLLSYVNQYDAVYWYKLFGSAKKHPAFWIPLDFSSILFALGYPPDGLGHDSFYKEFDIERSGFREHHALDDARLLALCYKMLMSKVDNA